MEDKRGWGEVDNSGRAVYDMVSVSVGTSSVASLLKLSTQGDVG